MPRSSFSDQIQFIEAEHLHEHSLMTQLVLMIEMLGDTLLPRPSVLGSKMEPLVLLLMAGIW